MLFQHRMMMVHVNNQAQHLKEKIHIHSCAFCPLNTLHAKLANHASVLLNWHNMYHQKEEMLFYSLFGVNSKKYSVVSPGCCSISSSQNPEVDLLSHVKKTKKQKRSDVWFMRAMQEKHFIIMLY